MAESKMQIRDRIVEAFLDHVPFDGWSLSALKAGVRDAGYDEGTGLRVFGDSMRDVADHFADWSDRRMLAELEKLNTGPMKVRERIYVGVKTRLHVNAPYREAIRRLASFLALPGNVPLATGLAWRTSSAIWYWAGDRSADWNHYTKRGLLASVYTSTLLYWLADEPDNGEYPETLAFLNRRLDDVLRVFGLPRRLKKVFCTESGKFGLSGG